MLKSWEAWGRHPASQIGDSDLIGVAGRIRGWPPRSHPVCHPLPLSVGRACDGMSRNKVLYMAKVVRHSSWQYVICGFVPDDWRDSKLEISPAAQTRQTAVVRKRLPGRERWIVSRSWNGPHWPPARRQAQPCNGKERQWIFPTTSGLGRGPHLQMRSQPLMMPWF